MVEFHHFRKVSSREMTEKKSRYFKPGISKDTFCKALTMIRRQEGKDSAFSEALCTMGDGHFLFGIGNEYLKALLLVLKEAVDDSFDYIGWWLYEAEDYHVCEHDNSKEWYLKDPGDLYDFICNDCEHKEPIASGKRKKEGDSV